jgi:hypothetical protein
MLVRKKIRNIAMLIMGGDAFAARAAELANLKDIHSPKPVGLWPLAVGWYILFFLIAILMSAVGFSIYKNIRINKAKKEALLLLHQYENEFKQKRNIVSSCARVSELLKRVALFYYPREKVAALSGDAWVQFLNETSQKLDFQKVSNELVVYPYKPPTAASTDLHLFFSLSREWIKQRRQPCSN